MSESGFPRRTIDDAIDRAVREIMSHDPRPGLRRRVLSRLERGANAQVGVRLLFPLAALITIVLAVVLWRPGDSQDPGKAPAQVASTQSAPSRPVSAASATAAVEPVAPRARPEPPPRQARGSETIFGPRSGRVTATGVAAAAEAIAGAPAPLDPETDIEKTVAPIVVAPLPSVVEIRVAPIEVQRITVPALPIRRQ